MSETLDKIRALRAKAQSQSQSQSPSPPLTVPTDSIDARLDSIFAAAEAKLNVQRPPQKQVDTPPAPPTNSVEIYSTFGLGSILVNNKSVSLPYIVTSPLELLQLQSQYDIDSPHSYLRSRRIP